MASLSHSLNLAIIIEDLLRAMISSYLQQSFAMCLTIFSPLSVSEEMENRSPPLSLFKSYIFEDGIAHLSYSRCSTIIECYFISFFLSKLKKKTLVLWHIVFALLQTLCSFSTYAENVLTKGRPTTVFKGLTNTR